MLNKGDEQTQEVASGATAIQAQGNVDNVIINNGLSYTEVRDVALDVFRANFIQLTGVAEEVARKRAQEITDKFLETLQEVNPEGIEQFQNPDFQHNLYSVQRDYARTADVDLGDLLVNLLADRTKHPTRDMAQIVLNECLQIAPKLTNEQLSALSVMFFFKQCSTSGILTFEQMAAQLDKIVQPFIDTLPRKASSFKHLEFAGCGTVQLGSVSLEEILWMQYQGLFTKGFDPIELSGLELHYRKEQHLICVSLMDPSKQRVCAQNLPHLDVLLQKYRVSEADAPRIRKAFSENRMQDEDIRRKCVELRPYMQSLFDLWYSTDLHNMTLTTIGIGLAHANIKRLTGEFADLSIWVN